MKTNEYLTIVNEKHQSGIAREHSYRAALENLIKTLVPDVQVTNEPAKVTDCGNPDYVITKGKIPIGYIEAKDIGKDLKSKQYKEQFTRYKKALDNLIITDYIWFRFFVKGELVSEIRIAEITDKKIEPLSKNFDEFENRIRNFCSFVGETIKSPKKLAGMMAAKARLLQIILEKAVTSDEESTENTSLRGQYKTFKDILIHDLKPKEFADIYAQTLAYGMFAARLNDPTPDDFSRQEAANLIPKTNPFLRKLFQYVAGYDIDERIQPTVDNLAEVFRATNVKALLKNFGSATQQNDPIIHFYETFLGQYDAKLKKARGVWYTPEPVVKFIVRAVDDILKTEFGLKKGLADNSKIKIKVNTQIEDKRSSTGYKQVEKEVHKVQILDPAAGTGTFLAEVVKYIYNKNFKAMQGAWSNYVENDLIPRLNGFELLMASYAMAHLKLSMLLEETGFKPKKDQRFRVYLTNSLEKEHPDTGTLFANWLSSEANEANHIKRDTPVMCVIGNPPYAVSSSNKSGWVQGLIKDYKKNLNERKINLDDDYIKFIRFGQYFIDKNGEGILAYISNNSFIDGTTHRQMRKHLLQSFDKIYILDLHGNTRKKETTPDGSTDQNVFDIMAGVSINIFVKTGKKKKNTLGEIMHFDLFGKRESKYSFLNSNSLGSVGWGSLTNQKPNFFFVYKDYKLKSKFDKGIKIDDLFKMNSAGIETQKDKITIHFTKDDFESVYSDFLECTEEEIRNKYPHAKDTRDWTIATSKQDLKKHGASKIKQIVYRPFDNRFSYMSGKSKGFLAYPRHNITKHMLPGNLSLLTCKRQTSFDFQHVFLVDKPSERCTVSLQTGEVGYIFPLYLYPTPETDGIFTEKGRKPNLSLVVVEQIAKKLGLKFTSEKELADGTFAPIDILDYTYGVLHSPSYREKYKEFLKIDFPRVPFPKNTKTFWELVALGGELRQIHLLESEKVEEYITAYPEDGDNQVTRKMTKTSIGFELTNKETKTGKVWINDQQYFDKVPLVAWEFYIGGYQPAQKWLKDRRGRTLDFDDILHYQKIIAALSETDRIMKEIDKINFE